MKLEDIAEPIEEATLPFLDRSRLDSAAEASLTEDQRFWREQGYLIKRNFLPPALIDRYVEARSRHEEWPGQPNAYMDSPEMRDLCLNKGLTEKLKELIGIEMVLCLVLSGWRSSERNWHQDAYLVPMSQGGGYSLAVWIALEEIVPDAGPFQYVPRSHHWPVVGYEKIREMLPENERSFPAWPKFSERILTRIFEKRIKEEGLQVKEFVPASKGDILIWHTFLAHRGSVPKNPNLTRRSLIAHYAGVGKRSCVPPAVQHKDQGRYYPVPYPAIKVTGPPPASLPRPKWPRLRRWAKKIPGAERIWRQWKGRPS